jgi:S1-C subfamily serine protease
MVEPGSPAGRAGLEDAVYVDEAAANNLRAVPTAVDIITAIDGEPLSGMSELIGYLASETQPGDTVTLSVLRLGDDNTEGLQFEVRLTPRP